jgi:asparagine synthase (glutamine-hydrolysing)
VTAQGVSSHRHWNPDRRELKLARPEEYEEGLREQMDRAVAVRLRGSGGRVASHLSAGLDSSAVAATAARLLQPEGGSVTAYTSVPREGFEGRGIGTSIADEGPLAASVAALHPNMEHVKIRSGALSPIEKLDPYFFLFERPFLNLCNGNWATAILDDARARRLGILLTGQAGNMTISYDGMQHLAELAKQGRLLRLSRLAGSLVANGTRLGTVAAQVLGPFLPVPLWEAIGRVRGKGQRVTESTAINAAQLPALERAARERALDFSYRPRSDPWETRLWVLGRVDHGNYNKGMLGGWGVDVRDPTADRRLAEWCLSVPAEQFLHGGVPRSLARRAFRDRLPAALLDERRKGFQAADWHEGLTAARGQLVAEVERLREVAPAGETLDLARMEKLLADWPEGDWHKDKVMRKYRLALLRGISAGHFLRRASGSNA